MAVMTTPQEEEREARKRFREGQRLARLGQQAREQAEREERKRRRREAREALDELRPRLRAAQREYDRLRREALRDRRGDTSDTVAARFDAADKAMGALMALGRRERELREVIR